MTCLQEACVLYERQTQYSLAKNLHEGRRSDCDFLFWRELGYYDHLMGKLDHNWLNQGSVPYLLVWSDFLKTSWSINVHEFAEV